MWRRRREAPPEPPLVPEPAKSAVAEAAEQSAEPVRDIPAPPPGRVRSTPTHPDRPATPLAQPRYGLVDEQPFESRRHSNRNQPLDEPYWVAQPPRRDVRYGSR
jgi:hypothetical protein